MFARTLVLFAALSSAAFAQEDPKPNLTYKAVTEIDFLEIAVDGVVDGPNISFTSERRVGVHPPMIHLRHDFNTEMDRSVDQIR